MSIRGAFTTRFFSIRSNLQTNPVMNDFAAQEFKIKVNDDYATVTYKKIDEGTYDLVHSMVPEMYQGQGLGAILAERVFDHLLQTNEKAKVSCEYLQKFISSSGTKYNDCIVH